MLAVFIKLGLATRLVFICAPLLFPYCNIGRPLLPNLLFYLNDVLDK